METLKKNKNILIILALCVVGFLLYTYVFKADEPLTTVDSSSSASLIGQELVGEINRLNSLKKVSASYTALFSDPAFMSLNDIQVNVQSRPVGRQNPFLSSGL